MLPFQSFATVPAVLVLADGTIFQGLSIGASGHTVGEVVFNTSMTGYQEILTDPSYSRQLVTLTYPHIGNVGVNAEDAESDQVYAAGLVIRDLSLAVSNFRSQSSLQDYLSQRGVVAIADIDTRQLTRILRDKGSQGGCILAGEGAHQALEVERALALAQGFPGMAGLDLAQTVSTKKTYHWNQPSWKLEASDGALSPESKFHVVAYDYGVKHNILRMLVDRHCRVTVVPAQTSIDEVLALRPDGVFLSNGPGDPEPCDYAINAVKELIKRRIPSFGICLGHQIMGLAAGAKTLKMKFGHHGANHPVQDLDTKKVFITSQNHGFAVSPEGLPDTLRVTHVSLFDGSIQGLEHTSAPAFCFQGHPEASPGPHDIGPIFDRFIALMERAQLEKKGADHA